MSEEELGDLAGISSDGSELGSPEIPDQTPTSRTCRDPRQLFGQATPLSIPDRSDNGNDFQKLILKELQNTNAAIRELSGRVTTIDGRTSFMNERLKKVEEKQSVESTPSSSSVEPKNKVPRQVRVSQLASLFEGQKKPAIFDLLFSVKYELCTRL